MAQVSIQVKYIPKSNKKKKMFFPISIRCLRCQMAVYILTKCFRVKYANFHFRDLHFINALYLYSFKLEHNILFQI